MQSTEQCPICGESLCKHGLCSNTGSPWRDGCPNSYRTDGYQCQDCAEVAWQRQYEEYYGASTPQTDAEREEVRRQR